jgi:hypothetical protein
MYNLNLFFLKNTNGIFYYALDSYNELEILPQNILVNSKIHDKTKFFFKKSNVIKCNYLTFFYHIIKSCINKSYIYTPTSHPLPFISKQFVVLHDLFVFTGFIGKLKKYLFIISVKSSNCKIIYINKCETLFFLKKLNIPKNRLIFLPNKFPEAIGLKKSIFNTKDKVKIGLFGTDSEKKNYYSLFKKIIDMNIGHLFDIRIYGHETDYYNSLINHFSSDFSIKLFLSDKVSIENFTKDLDLVISVAESEGFSRPIALSLVSGIPCFLLRSNVFLEFYNPGAFFYNSTKELLLGVLKYPKDQNKFVGSYLPPHKILSSFKSGILILKNFILN